MEMLTRTVAMLFFAGVLATIGAEAEARGPRTLLTVALRPVAGAPVAAKGKAKFDQSTSRTNFSVEAEKMFVFNGKVASIFVNGVLVGSRPVALGQIKLELTNQRGGTVPAVAAGTRVTVMVGTITVLSGTF